MPKLTISQTSAHYLLIYCSESLRDFLTCIKSLAILNDWALCLAFSSNRAILSFSSFVRVSWVFSYYLLSKEIDSNPCLNCSLSGRSLSSRLFSGFSDVRFGIAYGTKRNGLTHKIQQNFEKNSTKFRDINEHVCHLAWLLTTNSPLLVYLLTSICWGCAKY